MEKFRYIAWGADGQRVEGQIDAPDIEHAFAQLARRGLRSVNVVPVIAQKGDAATMGDPAAQDRGARPSATLSADEARELTEQLAMLARAGLPLAPGLRAAAEDLSNRRLKQALVALAERLEAGKPLDEILTARPQLLPGHLSKLVETSVRSGRLAEVLTRLVEMDRDAGELKRLVRLAISYPVILVATYVAVVVFLGLYVIPDLATFYSEFRLQLPWATMVLVWFSGHRMLAALGIVVAAVPLVSFALRAALPPAARRRLLTKIPLVGPVILWRGVAGWARLLGLLVDQGVAAPEALRLVAAGIDDAHLAAESRRMAQAVSAGRGLADSLVAARRMPATIVPVVRWGENEGQLAEALATVGDLFATRVRLRAALLQSALPPIMFVVIGLGALFLITAFGAPIIPLIRALSSGM